MYTSIIFIHYLLNLIHNDIRFARLSWSTPFRERGKPKPDLRMSTLRSKDNIIEFGCRYAIEFAVELNQKFVFVI